MKVRLLSKWSLFSVGVIAMFCSIVIAALENRNNFFSPTQIVVPHSGASRSSLPVRLKVPKINIDATIEYVGLTPQGAMGVPRGPVNVAWYQLGPRPGEEGSAVLAGHEGWKDGIPAVFDDLHLLNKGDEILVQDGKGATTIFIVREKKIYASEGDATNVFNSTDGKAHLNLITCEGVWSLTGKSYANRLVVFADMK